MKAYHLLTIFFLSALSCTLKRPGTQEVTARKMLHTISDGVSTDTFLYNEEGKLFQIVRSSGTKEIFSNYNAWGEPTLVFFENKFMPNDNYRDTVIYNERRQIEAIIRTDVSGKLEQLRIDFDYHKNGYSMKYFEPGEKQYYLMTKFQLDENGENIVNELSKTDTYEKNTSYSEFDHKINPYRFFPLYLQMGQSKNNACKIIHSGSSRSVVSKTYTYDNLDYALSITSVINQDTSSIVYNYLLN